MFTGFDVDYPEYEVITPQGKQSFTVKTLNVLKEERLKGSLITPIQITEHLDRIIWESIVKKPENIKTYEDFKKNVTVKDRDALLYGLYHVSYEEIRNYDVSCAKCGKTFPITVQASSTFDFHGYPGDDILTKRVTFPLPKSPSVSVVLKQPTLEDEIRAYKILSAKTELIGLTLPIEKFIQERKNGEMIVDDRQDIIDAYLSLPPMDKRTIYKGYVDNFGQYGITLKCKVYCPDCGKDDVIDIDLAEQFFRMVLSIE